MSNQNSLNLSNTNLKANSSTNSSITVENDLSNSDHSINSSTANQTDSSNFTNIQNLLNNSNQNNLHNSLEQNSKLSSSTGNQKSSSNNSKNNISESDQVLNDDDDLSILVDNISNQNDGQTNSTNKLTSDLSFNPTNNNNLSNMTLTTTKKPPSDLLDAACLAITEDNPNLFNENFSIEITQSESDLTCELDEYVNNNILEHDLILEEVTDHHKHHSSANENDLIENLLMNEHQSKYSTTENKSKFNLNNLNNSSSQINNNTGIILPNSFNSHTNDDNLSNSSKKKSLNTSNVHLSYLLQTKPQDLSSSTHLQKHLQRKLVTADDNFVFG